MAGAALLAVTVTGCGGPGLSRVAPDGAAASSSTPTNEAAPIPAPDQRTPGSSPARSAVPGLGPKTMNKVPKRTHQVVVASTETKHGTAARTTLYRLGDDGGWTRVDSWAGHNGKGGWTSRHTINDTESPVGVYGLTDAGGYLADPGTKLSYDQEHAYRQGAVATYGPKYRSVFNYVIAIDFNRVPGSPPTDSRHPRGTRPGGKIWLHVDHDSPTHGCITLDQAGMKFLLTHLDPDAHPVIVTGPEPAIAR